MPMEENVAGKTRAGASAPWDNPKNVVLSLAKGLRVLEAFSAAEPALTLAEIARRADVDNATAFRLLNTMVMLGYVERIGESRDFRLSLKCLDLGFNAIARMELRDRVRPALRALVGEVSETASFVTLEGTDILYVERVQAGLTRLGVDIRVGSRVPAYCVSPGRAILAYLPKSEQSRVLDDTLRVKLTTNTITDLRELKARIAQVRRCGYCLVEAETTPGLRALAAAVLDVDGQPIGAVSVVAPVIRMPVEQFVELTRAPVQEAARAIAKVIQAGGAVEPPRAVAV